jgi:hypothetical protein
VSDTPIPASLDARPKDRRGLPIPASAGETPEGEYVPTAVDAVKAWNLGKERRCGVCGEAMGYWVAFVGGSASATGRAYSTPPMHVECAEASISLCPHINYRDRSRARKHKGEVTTMAGFVEDKPTEWFLYVTRSYEQQLYKDRAGNPAYVFTPAPPKFLRRFVYDDAGRIGEVKQ